MNKFQILGIIAAALAFVSVVSFYMYRPKPGVEASPHSYVSQIVLSLAVAATAIALILSNSDGLDNGSENYIPHMMHHQPQKFIMKEGLQKKSNSGKKSLGARLKEAGWVVCVADWCGFCVKQKALFAEHPDEELDQLIVAENDMSEDMKSRSQGFPAWMCMSSSADSPGYKANLADIEKLLTMN